jgi:2-C-methyl-D-erythritol 4-phosphate cytidylyltransferase
VTEPPAPHTIALVPAGGRGERYGVGPVPKQFQPLGGRPLLAWTLRRLQAAGCARLVVAVPADWLAWAAAELGAPVGTLFVVGGETRQASVERCLAAVPGEDDDLILVHDGARPATAVDDLVATIAAAAASGAAILGRPVHDTLKRLDGPWLGETVPREGLFRAETPQVFRRRLLVAGYAAAARTGFVATDEAGLVERLEGVRIRAVFASAPNPKLTRPADAVLLAALLGLG